jgi:citrate synthase
MSEVRVKKSVALSGVVAGDTALSTVGHTGNDLHYRGYEINDLAQNCEFEEVAYLMAHCQPRCNCQITKSNYHNYAIYQMRLKQS